jgi:endo-alpha-1,4-polygalactosaminidase (GH114 family)
MDKLKKSRGIQRAAVTKILNKVEVEFKKDQPDLEILNRSSRRLVELREKLGELDEKVIDKMVDSNATEEETTIETDSTEDFLDKIVQAQDAIEKATRPRPPSPHPSIVSTNEDDKRKTYKLPKVEIRKFSGEVLDWLSWWHQFERIHEDEDLHDTDKFQYLTQAIEEKSKAADLIRVYPQTGANYPKAVKALQERFGKPKILKRVYVRELLHMIIQNSREQSKVSVTYDKLEAHLKALESLGVSPDQMDVILFPMVESCLPEEILVAWLARSKKMPLSSLFPTIQT